MYFYNMKTWKQEKKIPILSSQKKTLLREVQIQGLSFQTL